MKTPRHRPPPASAAAFTLIEVMVATTIFFMGVFAILGVLGSGIHAASMLRSSGPTPGMVAAYYCASNSLDEGGDSGDFSDIAGYEGYTWRSNIREVDTNGLFQVDIAVSDPKGNQSSVLSVLYFKSAATSGLRMGLQQGLNQRPR
jgi:Tfp pilus assembly protein PilV